MTAGILRPPGLWLPPREIVLPRLRPMLSVIGRALGFMGGGGPVIDPYWSSVQLLLHGDGADGGTTITDSSQNALTMTVNSVTTSTTAPKFGTASLLFNGTSDYVSTTSALPKLGAGDFTVEFWAKMSTTASASTGHLAHSGATGADWIITASTDGTGGTVGKLNFWGGSGGLFTSTTSIDDGSFHFCAISRVSGTLNLYVDGNREATGAHSTNFSTALTQIGNGYKNPVLDTRIDDYRVTVGVGRYSGATCAVPAAAFPHGS